MIEDLNEIDEIIEEQSHYPKFISKLDEWAELTIELKKHFRKEDRKKLEEVLKNAKTDFPFMEVRNDQKRSN